MTVAAPPDVGFDTLGERLPVHWLEQRPARVQVLAFATLRAVLIGLAGHDDHAPPGMVEAARRALDDEDLATVAAVYRRPVFVPDCLAYDPRWGAVSAAEELERIGDTTPQELLAEIDAHDHGRAEPWRTVRRDPAAFLRRHHRALTRAWSAVEPFWQRASPGLERELIRASVAIGRGTVAELLLAADPAPPPCAQAERLRLDERGVVLIPQLAGVRRRHLRRRDGDVLTHVAYPVPGAARIVGDDAPPETLEALLGPQRTMILRHLDHPRTVGRLAELLFAVASAATHHVDALQAAGLVTRERQGRHVLVHRTARGTELLGLYERDGA